jgi:HK97 gp10 family phage protein
MNLITRKSNWSKLLSEFDDTTAVGLKRTALEIRKEAQNRVPVDDGDLRSSIAVVERVGGDPLAVEVTAGNSVVDYAGFIEFGTRYAAAQPFLTPALQAVDRVRGVILELNQLIRKSQIR